MNKKTTFNEVVEKMIRKAQGGNSRAGDIVEDADQGKEIEAVEPEQVVRSLLPRLNDTLFEILGDAPFQGMGVLMGQAGPYRFSGERLITSIVTFTLRVLGGQIIPKYKLTLAARVDGIPQTEPIRVNDVLTVDVTCEKLADVAGIQR